jgi:hypothetical protein
MPRRLLMLASLILMNGSLSACTGNTGSAGFVPREYPILDVGGSGHPAAPITRLAQDVGTGGGPVNRVDDVSGGGPVTRAWMSERTGSAQ